MAANIEDITICYDSIDCAGAAPSITGYKPGDLVRDISNGRLWQWNGTVWRPYAFQTACQVKLPVGMTLAERLASPAEELTQGIIVMSGNDPQAPANFVTGEDTIIIKHMYGYPVSSLMLSYQTPDGVWVTASNGSAMWTAQSSDLNYTAVVGLLALAGSNPIRINLTFLAGA